MVRHSRRARDAGLRRINTLTKGVLATGLVVTAAASGAAAAGFSNVTLRSSKSVAPGANPVAGFANVTLRSSKSVAPGANPVPVGPIPANLGNGSGNATGIDGSNGNATNDPGLQPPSDLAPSNSSPDLGGGGGVITQSGGS